MKKAATKKPALKKTVAKKPAMKKAPAAKKTTSKMKPSFATVKPGKGASAAPFGKAPYSAPAGGGIQDNDADDTGY